MSDVNQSDSPLDPNLSSPEEEQRGVSLPRQDGHTLIVDEEQSYPPLPFPIVAMGASKGGLDAYIELLRNLPADTGMAYVVLLHMPNEPSTELPQILSSHTSMTVQLIEHGRRPEPNHVYVLPPMSRATIQHGIFRLQPRPENEKVPMPIDHFFRSVAADQKNRVIGVVLSGADSDGALGLRMIKGEGGIAIVQDPESARVEDMPRSSILVDHIDLILPPAEIAVELTRIARQFFQPSLHLLEEGHIAPSDEPHFNRLLTLLSTIGGIDFRNYKPGTIRRRTARRMVLRRLEKLSDYVRYLQESKEELRNLQEDVLINVTRFSRDPSVFDALKSDILPTLFDNRPPDQQLRMWIAGCASGEEAYSIAICVLEYIASQAHEPTIQIFGTDASDRSIEKARTGVYPESISKEISAERLRRFFVKTDKGYQIAKRVRDLCIFARQNLCNDPPFSRLDLITCRNVLIYLERETQNHIISTFHYALRPNGCLLLGRSESIADTAGLFTPIDRKNKVYAKLGDGNHHGVSVLRPALALPAPGHTPQILPPRGLGPELDVQRAADRILLVRHAPPGVVINESMEVLEVRGRPAPFLAITPGLASLHLLRMAHGDIIPALRDAVSRAVESGVPMIEDIAVHQGEERITAKMEVLPIQVGSTPIRHYLVVFVTNASSVTGREIEEKFLRASDTENSDHELSRLHRVLTTTRLYLQSLIEERDVRNQELTAAYEEIQSSNEELQSTNEELETAKEELQSTNEELQTVNDELRNRNHALLQASNDLMNLLNSVNIPVVMLGSDLTIRQYTQPAERLMRLRAADVGRPISEIRLNLTLDDIEPLLQEVLETLVTKETEVQDRSGRWHLLRLRPYRTAENKIEGVVLLLLDIDQMRRSQEALQQTRDFAQIVVEAVQVPVVVLDGELRVRTANAAFREMSGLNIADVDRRPFPDLLTMIWDWPDLRPKLLDLIGRTEPGVLEVEHEFTRPVCRDFRLVARAVRTDGEPAVLIVLDDITAHKQAERLLETDRERLAGQVRSTVEVLSRTREELRALAARLFTTQEEERRRVARELHDDVSQRLAILEMDLEKLRQTAPNSTPEVQKQVQDVAESIRTLSQDVRNLSHQLHPSMLDHLGLAESLRNLVEEFGHRENMVATFRRVDVAERLPDDVSTALYRIAQEALRNVAKHAGRTHVKVLLEGTNEGVRLSIRDLGDGFDLDGSARRGLGLVSMEERARLVGGALHLHSELGQGTVVTVIVPLREAAGE